MTSRFVRTALLLFFSAVIATLGTATYIYRTDIQEARDRVATGSSLAHTSCGPIEYAVTGDGPPVLVVHGAGGGFDQGLDFGEPLAKLGLVDRLFDRDDVMFLSAHEIGHGPNCQGTSGYSCELRSRCARQPARCASCRPGAAAGLSWPAGLPGGAEASGAVDREWRLVRRNNDAAFDAPRPRKRPP